MKNRKEHGKYFEHERGNYMLSKADATAAKLAAIVLGTEEIEMDMIDNKIDQMGLRFSAIVRAYGVQQYQKGYEAGKQEERHRGLKVVYRNEVSEADTKKKQKGRAKA